MPEKKPHPLNCEGPFYVEDGCCIRCDLPRTLAPDMFKYTAAGDHCYIYKQPETKDQLSRMIKAMEGAEVLCVRCRTRDKELLRLLGEKKLDEQCGFSQSGAQSAMPNSSDPEAVVQRQLDAFNARDIEALLATYAEDAQMFEQPSKLLASGSAAFRERYTGRFQEPNLRATLLKRIVMGNVVIDHEEVTRTFPEGPGKIALIMIYEVQNGRIARAWSIAGAKTLDAL